MRLPFPRAIAPMCAVLSAVIYAPSLWSPRSRPGGIRGAGVFVPGAPESVTAFVDVAVVPMDKERVLSHQTVLVKGGRISAVGPVSAVRVPAGATRIDGRGKFLIPGLADMHAHLSSGLHVACPNGGSMYGSPADSTGVETRLFLWLANGVTTVRNMDYHNEEWGKRALRLRALAAEGRAWIPRIYTAGQFAPTQYLWKVDDGDPKPVLDSIATYVAAYKAAGYDFIKIHDETPEVLDSVLAAAKRVGIPVVGHVPRPVRVEHVIPGYQSIEHPFTDYIWNKNDGIGHRADTTGFGGLAATLRRAGVWHCPTQAHYNRWHRWNGEPPELLKVEQDSGVALLLGTDEYPWLGVITSELQALVGAGLTPYQALLTGTRNVAAYFGTLRESGTVDVVKLADLVLLTGNPLQDVRYTAQPAGVMLGGRWLPREDINRRLAGLSLGIYSPGEPLKSYWNNVADRAGESALAMFDRLHLTDARQEQLRQLRVAHEASQKALADSLGTSDQYTAGTQRVLSLVARQIGEDRLALLTPEQQATFDQDLRYWIQHRRAEGYSVSIQGVQP